MIAVAQFIRTDFWEASRLAALAWLVLGGSYVARSAFQPSLRVLIVGLPLVWVIVFALHMFFFFLLYFLNGRDFAISYAKLRGR